MLRQSIPFFFLRSFSMENVERFFSLKVSWIFIPPPQKIWGIFLDSFFAISTLITWSYYGLRCWTYIFGISIFSKYSFKLIFLSFTIIGTSLNLGSVINFSDSMIFAMSIPNIIGLYFLSSKLKKDLIRLN